eukprot:5708893-Prymnesium_polylepis.2
MSASPRARSRPQHPARRSAGERRPARRPSRRCGRRAPASHGRWASDCAGRGRCSRARRLGAALVPGDVPSARRAPPQSRRARAAACGRSGCAAARRAGRLGAARPCGRSHGQRDRTACPPTGPRVAVAATSQPRRAGARRQSRLQSARTPMGGRWARVAQTSALAQRGRGSRPAHRSGRQSAAKERAEQVDGRAAGRRGAAGAASARRPAASRWRVGGGA